MAWLRSGANIMTDRRNFPIVWWKYRAPLSVSDWLRSGAKRELKNTTSILMLTNMSNVFYIYK